MPSFSMPTGDGDDTSEAMYPLFLRELGISDQGEIKYRESTELANGNQRDQDHCKGKERKETLFKCLEDLALEH